MPKLIKIIILLVFVLGSVLFSQTDSTKFIEGYDELGHYSMTFIAYEPNLKRDEIFDLLSGGIGKNIGISKYELNYEDKDRGEIYHTIYTSYATIIEIPMKFKMNITVKDGKYRVIFSDILIGKLYNNYVDKKTIESKKFIHKNFIKKQFPAIKKVITNIYFAISQSVYMPTSNDDW